MDPSGRLWPSAELRAGDADRHSVVVELQRHFVEGRLTSSELDERVAQVLAARTFGELSVPLSDLPVLASAPAALEPAGESAGRLSRFSMFLPALGVMLVIIGVMALFWMLKMPEWHAEEMPFWPVFVLGFFVFGWSRRGSRRARLHRGGRPTRSL